MSDDNVIQFPGSVTEPAEPAEPTEPPPPSFDEWSAEASAHITSLIVDLDELSEAQYRQRMAEIAQYAHHIAAHGGAP